MDLVNLNTGETAINVPHPDASSLLSRGYRDATSVSPREWLGAFQRLQPATGRSSQAPFDSSQLAHLKIEMG